MKTVQLQTAWKETDVYSMKFKDVISGKRITIENAGIRENNQSPLEKNSQATLLWMSVLIYIGTSILGWHDVPAA